MVLFVEDCEEQSVGTAFTNSNSAFDGVAGTATCTFDSTVIHTGQSMKFAYSASFRQMRKSITATNTLKSRFKFKFSTLPGGNIQLAAFRAAGANVAVVQMQATGKIRFLNVATSVADSGAVLCAANTVYYIEFEVNAGAGVIRLYNSDGTTLLSTLTVASGVGGSIDQIGFGSSVADTLNLWFDAMAADPTTQPGYPSTGLADAAYVWDGSALVACDAYVWDGSALVACDPYFWDGTTLV